VLGSHQAWGRNGFGWVERALNLVQNPFENEGCAEPREGDSVRKALASIAASLAVIALIGAACTSTSSTAPPAGGSSSAPALKTITPGELLVASCLDYKPFEAVQNGNPVGFDIDLTDAIAAKLGLTVTWKKATFGPGMFAAVAANQYDMVAAAVTITPKRAQTLTFSDPYFDADQALSINTAATPDIVSLDGLKPGQKIGVQANTTGADYAQANAPSGVDIVSFPELPQAFNALEGGSVQAVVNDLPSSLAEIKSRPNTAVVQGLPTGEHYGFGFSPTNPGLVAAWNDALAKVIADGTWESLYKKWLPGAEVPDAYKPTS
jgi:polar amino acid transport system substrate-binding protein